MTPQEKMQKSLNKSSIPAKSINVYGSQIVITCRSLAAANRWAALLAHFANVRGIVETFDYNQENTNTVLRPSKHRVWRVGAVIT